MNHDDRLRVATILKKLEAFRSTPYWDVKGWSVGYGHFLGQNKGAYVNGITEPQAHDLLMKDIQTVEAAIPKYIKVPINSRQEAALVLWAFNFGPNRLSEATFAKKINEGIKDRADIAKGDGTNGWESWNKLGGKYHEGLHQRRIMEVAIFFGDAKIPLPKYSGGGYMDWQQGQTANTVQNVAQQKNASLPDIPDIPDFSAKNIIPYMLGGVGLLTLIGGLVYFIKD